MINSYKGEFTVVPWAMEMSFFNCSHACKYCFANLARVDRKFDIKKVATQLINAPNRKQTNILNYLLTNKFVTLISNRVDPFSKNNHKLSLNFIDMCRDLNMPLTYQTKGGKGIDEVLNHNKKEHWYISIPMLDDTLRKIHEPNAPSIEERLDLIYKLKSFNQDVCVGINPTWSRFFQNDDELRQLLIELKKRDATGVAFNLLHFGSKQRQGMTERTKRLYFDDKGKLIKDDVNILFQYSKIAKEEGLEPFFVGYPYESNYFTKAIKIYGKNSTMPTMQEFINMLYKNNNQPVKVYFEDFLKFLSTSKIIQEKFTDCHGYIFNSDMGHWIENKMMPSEFTGLKDVLKKYWNISNLGKSFTKYDCFYFSGDEENGVELDSDENAILIFNPIKIEDFKC